MTITAVEATASSSDRNHYFVHKTESVSIGSSCKQFLYLMSFQIWSFLVGRVWSFDVHVYNLGDIYSKNFTETFCLTLQILIFSVAKNSYNCWECFFFVRIGKPYSVAMNDTEVASTLCRYHGNKNSQCGLNKDNVDVRSTHNMAASGWMTGSLCSAIKIAISTTDANEIAS